MNTNRLLAASALLFAGLFASPHPARAAESYDNCAGTISSLPTTISTQGVWCLKGDLATNIASGNAITIAVNNVTIDCNDFKLGGLAAGDASIAIGIYAENRQNAVIRHCGIRGFYRGIYLNGGAGHLVEDNRLDNNLFFGIGVFADNSMVRRNRVYDTGGYTGENRSYGVGSSGDIIDNTVSGQFAYLPGGYLIGVELLSDGTVARDNHVSGFDTNAANGGGSNSAYGIYSFAPTYAAIAGNSAFGPGGTSIGTTGSGGGGSSQCMDNMMNGFTTNYAGCTLTSAQDATTYDRNM